MFKTMFKQLRSIANVQRQLVLTDAVVAPMTISVLEKQLEELRRLYPQPKRDELTDSEQYYAKSGQKIAAIKAVRERTGYGLLEAKNLVEAWQRTNGY